MGFDAYLVTCVISDKQYIGITTKGVKHRWQEHLDVSGRGASGLLHKAIRKYGREAFLVCHIASSEDRKSLGQLECQLILQYGTLVPSGYNLTLGGEGMSGFQHSFETRKNMSLNRRGRKLSSEQKRLMSKNAKERWGRLSNSEKSTAIESAMNALSKAQKSLTENRGRWIKNLSASQHRWWARASDEQRASGIQARRSGRWPDGHMTQEERERHRDRMRNMWAKRDAKKRAAIGSKIRLASIGRKMPDSHRKATSLASAKRFSLMSPEERSAWVRKGVEASRLVRAMRRINVRQLCLF